MRALAAAVVLVLATGTAVADDGPTLVDRTEEDPAAAEARDAAKLFFMAIAGSEDSYLKEVMRAPVGYEGLRFEDPKCGKTWKGKGKVTKGKLGKFATCVLALVRKLHAGELGYTAGVADKHGTIAVTAANSAVSYELTLRRAKDGTFQVTALRGKVIVARTPGLLQAPDAADLGLVLQGIKGKGALTATIATSMGDIHCELFENETPRTVANFVGLATGQWPWKDPTSGTIKTGVRYYDGLTFHRVIPGFMIQGGDPIGNGTGGPGYQFPDEIVNGITNRAGSLAMANAGRDTNGSQFFINEVDNKHLDGANTVFGHCGQLDVVKAIGKVPADSADRPRTPVTITAVTISRRN
jgi:cyclophilin family peptidyl-prolyl cis-trans isomerase